MLSSFLFIRIQQKPSFYASALLRESKKSWKDTLDHYAQEAVKKLKDQKAVEEVTAETEDDDMEDNDDSQPDEVKPPKIPVLQLTEYVLYHPFTDVVDMGKS
jgi:cobalamin biosynthesis protein CobT